MREWATVCVLVASACSVPGQAASDGGVSSEGDDAGTTEVTTNDPSSPMVSSGAMSADVTGADAATTADDTGVPPSTTSDGSGEGPIATTSGSSDGGESGSPLACGGGVQTDCPTGVEVSTPSYTGHQVFGNAVGGNDFDDPCPAGAAVVGATGAVGGNVDQFAAVCAQIELDVDFAAQPAVLTIVAGAQTTLTTHGTFDTNDYTIMCPADEFVVGISGEAGPAVSAVTLHCAALLVSGSTGAWTIDYGSVSTQTASGTNDAAAYMDMLAAPEVVSAFRGRAGGLLDAVGLGASTITLVP